MLQKAEWEKAKNDNVWSFVGNGDEFKLDLVQKNINNFFSENTIYFVMGRHKSKEIKKEAAAKEVESLLTNQDITLCNKEFKRFIVFSYIGVAKQGVYHS